MTTVDRPYAKTNIRTQSVPDRSLDQVALHGGDKGLRRHRARALLFTFGLVSAVFAAVIALRVVVRLTMFLH